MNIENIIEAELNDKDDCVEFCVSIKKDALIKMINKNTKIDDSKESEQTKTDDTMNVWDYRHRMMEVFRNADCEELIPLCVFPNEKDFQRLEWELRSHYMPMLVMST